MRVTLGSVPVASRCAIAFHSTTLRPATLFKARVAPAAPALCAVRSDFVPHAGTRVGAPRRWRPQSRMGSALRPTWPRHVPCLDGRLRLRSPRIALARTSACDHRRSWRRGVRACVSAAGRRPGSCPRKRNTKAVLLSFHLPPRPRRLQVAIARTVGGKFTAVRLLPLPARGCLPARKGWPMCCGPVRHQSAASGGCTAHTAPTTRCCCPTSPLLFCRLTRAPFFPLSTGP